MKIGNSRGVRIPEPLLEQAGLHDDVELLVERNQLVIRSSRHPRDGWDELFQAIAAAGDDRLLDEVTPTKFDETEWEW